MKNNYKISDIPEWNMDGSSCYMVNGDITEVVIKPV
jgi:hypothetical protein